MKRVVLFLAMIFMISGCGKIDDWFGRSGGPSQPSVSSARKQLNKAQDSFDNKLQAARGRSIEAARKDWGTLEAGLSQGGLTVYKWSQTAELTTPDGEPSQGKSGKQTVSCLAMFIADPDGLVVDSTSEGRCFDLSKMPAWKPVVTQSTDGRTGPVR